MKNYGAVWSRCSNAFNHGWCFRCLQSDDHCCGNRLLALLQRGLQDQKCQWEWNQQKERGSYDPFWIMENLLPRRYLISHLLPLPNPLPFSLPLPHPPPNKSPLHSTIFLLHSFHHRSRLVGWVSEERKSISKNHTQLSSLHHPPFLNLLHWNNLWYDENNNKRLFLKSQMCSTCFGIIRICLLM